MSAPAKTPAVLQEGLFDVLRRGEELKGELHDKFAEGRDRKNVRGRLKHLFSRENNDWLGNYKYLVARNQIELSTNEKAIDIACMRDSTYDVHCDNYNKKSDELKQEKAELRACHRGFARHPAAAALPTKAGRPTLARDNFYQH